MENKSGLWQTKSKKGTVYYTGKIKIEDKEYQVSLFKNENKLNDKSPDYNIMLKLKEEKKEENNNVYVDFGNQTEGIKDEDIAF